MSRSPVQKTRRAAREHAARLAAPAGTPRPRNGQPDPDDYSHPASDVRARP